MTLALRSNFALIVSRHPRRRTISDGYPTRPAARHSPTAGSSTDTDPRAIVSDRFLCQRSSSTIAHGVGGSSRRIVSLPTGRYLCCRARLRRLSPQLYQILSTPLKGFTPAPFGVPRTSTHRKTRQCREKHRYATDPSNHWVNAGTGFQSPWRACCSRTGRASLCCRRLQGRGRCHRGEPQANRTDARPALRDGTCVRALAPLAWPARSARAVARSADDQRERLPYASPTLA